MNGLHVAQNVNQVFIKVLHMSAQNVDVLPLTMMKTLYMENDITTMPNQWNLANITIGKKHTPAIFAEQFIPS